MLGFSLFIKKKFKEDIEPQEVFLDNLAQKREEEIGISEKKIEVPLSKRVLQGLFLFFFILILALFAKTFQFQIIEGRDLSLLAEQNKFTVYSIKAERGVIYDRNFEQLVSNQPSFDLICHKTKLPHDESELTKILKEISYILGEDAEEIRDKIKEKEGPTVLISENLDHRTLILLEARIKEFPGFEIKNNTIRNYKDGEYFSHLIGYTGRIKPSELQTSDDYTIQDYVGRDGLEKTYEQVLRKEPGKARVERDTFGNPIKTEIISLPESGKSLVLYLDSGLQKKIVEEMKKTLKNVGAKKGAAVALDPRNGGVLALVSLPNFDNNLFSGGISQEDWNKLIHNPLKPEPLLNRVISGQYPTGSTIKPLIASAALQENVISPQKEIYCQGEIKIKNKLWPDVGPEFWEYHDWAVHYATDIRKAIAESCNVFFYTIGGGYENFKGLGVAKIKKYLELFGWGEKTGIDLPGEKEGLVPSPDWKEQYFTNPQDKIWGVGDTYYLSIGQGFLSATPLQVAASFVAIANGGTLYQPHVVQKIITSPTEVVKEIEPKIIRKNFIDPENLKIVREGMRQAVSGKNSPLASAVELNSLPVKVAAKTGTAQIGNGCFHNWITVFAPYDEPEIVLTIMIEDVKGEQVAAKPVAKNVLEYYFTR